MRLVVLVHLRAEGLFRLIEDHREMCRSLFWLHLLEELPEHAAEAVDGIDMRAVRRARLESNRVISAEDVSGTIDQEQVVALLERARGWNVRGRGGFRLGFGGGWHGSECGPGGRVNQSAKKVRPQKMRIALHLSPLWMTFAMQAR
jgi:hypothetical protein